MGIGKQAKVLTKSQINIMGEYLPSHQNRKRNLVIFLLSTRAGLRAKEHCLSKMEYATDFRWNSVVRCTFRCWQDTHLFRQHIGILARTRMPRERLWI